MCGQTHSDYFACDCCNKPYYPEQASVDMNCGSKKINGKRTAVALAFFLSPSALFAQGCAMCYQSAASSGSQFIQALRHGILIMFFPPILIMGLIYYAAYRKRNQFNTGESGSIADGATVRGPADRVDSRG